MHTDEKQPRLLQAAVALLSAARDRQLNTTNLNKAIFYLDLFALRDLGSSVTGSAFIALKQGPVVAKYEKRLIEPLEEAGFAVQEQDGMALPVRLVGEPGRPHLLSAAELEFARKVGQWFSEITAGRASDISHENPGWIIAFEEGLGAKKRPLPIDLHLAMQQIVEKDPWLADNLTSVERTAVAAADDCEGKAW